jgi:hypothetical protein
VPRTVKLSAEDAVAAYDELTAFNTYDAVAAFVVNDELTAFNTNDAVATDIDDV